MSPTIYDAPPAQPFPFAIGDPDLDEQLMFQAAHVWVSNPTNQALFLPDADDIVPAGITGRVLALKGTNVARASWNIPSRFALVQPPPAAGAVSLIFLHAGVEISPQSGTATPTPAFPGSVVPEIIQLLIAGGSTNATLTPPPGAQLQLIGPAYVTVTGVQTGFVYFKGLAPAAPTLLTLQGDTSVAVNVLIAPGPPFEQLIVNALRTSTLVTLSPTSGVAPQAPPAKGILAGAGTAIFVPGVVGQTVRVFGGMWNVAAVAAGKLAELQDTTGLPISGVRTDNIDDVPFEMDGSPATLGAGLQLVNSGASTDAVYVALTQS